MIFNFFNKDKRATNEDILNKGLKYAMEFGPTWRQPIQERLLAKYPFLSQIELDKYDRLCNEAMLSSCDFYYKKLEQLNNQYQTITKKEIEIIFKTFVQKDYDWIDNNNIKRLLGLAWYFAYHDGLTSVIR